jgi:hypothetical protein
VEAGLDPRDRLIYEGIQQVREGDPVIPEPLAFNQLRFN